VRRLGSGGATKTREKTNLTLGFDVRGLNDGRKRGKSETGQFNVKRGRIYIFARRTRREFRIVRSKGEVKLTVCLDAFAY